MHARRMDQAGVSSSFEDIVMVTTNEAIMCADLKLHLLTPITFLYTFSMFSVNKTINKLINK